MANKYTAEAYAGVQPIQEDFGDIAMQGLQVDMTLRAGELEREKQYTKLAQESQKNLEANLNKFNELAAGAMDFQAQAFDSQSISVLMAATKNEIADMRRELASPGISIERKSEIMTKIGTMKDRATSYKTQMGSFQKFIEGLANTGKGGIDDVMNAGVIGNLTEALMSAGKSGVKDLGGGLFRMGDRITFHADNGMLNYTIYGSDGNVMATGSPAEIQAKIGSRLKPYVDMNELFENAGKMVGDATIRSFVENPDGTVTNMETTNMAKIAERAGQVFDTMYKNNYANDPYMQKGATIGMWNNDREARNTFIDMVKNRAKATVKSSLQRNPNYAGYGDQRRMESIDNALDKIVLAMNGDKAAVQQFVGTKSVAFINVGDVNKRAQLADITVKGDVTTFKFLGEVKKGKGVRPGQEGYTEPFSISFDANNEDDQRKMVSILSNYWNGAAQPTEKLLDSDLANFNYGSTMYMKTKDDLQVRPFLDRLSSLAADLSSTEGKEDVAKKKNEIATEIDNAIKNNIFSLERGIESNWIGTSKKMTFKDKNTGKVLFSINFNDDPKKIYSDFSNAMGSIAEYSTIDGTPRKVNPNFRIRRNNGQRQNNVPSGGGQQQNTGAGNGFNPLPGLFNPQPK